MLFSLKPDLSNEKLSKDECDTEYQKFIQTLEYPTDEKKSGSLFGPRLVDCVHSFLSNGENMHGKLAVITGVYENSVGFHVSRQLAMQNMHVVMLGKSVSRLRQCQESIEKSVGSSSRNIYCIKFELGSFESILLATRQVRKICDENYDGAIHILANLAHVGTDAARLTKDGLEYNTGCNLVGTHLFTTELLELLEKTSAIHDRFARVVNANSLGHCCGTNFNPHRFANFPEQGGAPEGFLNKDNTNTNSSFDGDEATATLLTTETIAVTEEKATSPAEFQAAVEKRGTQVGRSKMALLALTCHMDRTMSKVHFYSVHVLSESPNRCNPLSFLWGSDNSTKAAIPFLRAALDRENLPSGCYLHSDGQPWEVMAPGDDVRFGQACFDATQKVTEKILASLVPSLRYETSSGGGYLPPSPGDLRLVSTRSSDSS